MMPGSKTFGDHMPELPQARKERYLKTYGLSDHDISILIDNKEMSEFFEEVMQRYSKDAKSVCNWLLSDVSAWLNKNEKTIDHCDLKKAGTSCQTCQDD